MSHAARLALQDCREAAGLLVDGIQGNAWRRQWILVIVLLRVVGHVLDKVDGERSSDYRRAVDAWWSSLRASKPDPAIFWQFIDEERNSLLKQYQTSAGQGVTIQVPLAYFNRKTGEQWTDLPLPTLYHYTMNSGPFAGRDHRDVVAEAIQWWEDELKTIDEAAGAA